MRNQLARGIRVWSAVQLVAITVSLLVIDVDANTRSRSPIYLDPDQPLEARVDDLVARMTLEEKILQMQNGAPAIPRLGIPAYDWWNEALHGVARAGIATVFPQAIGLAATFDPKMVRDVAEVASTEARAKHHEFLRNGDHGRYKGLTFWSPNINIFRDPRWGRGQETWGEDPYLTGTLGSEFVRGIQGNDPKYLKAVSTVKHFAVHSGPEPERHAFDAVVSERDLRDTYLPAFRKTIVEANSTGVMCAYNRVNGEPACANTRLMREILRGEWKFPGHVVSDCGAVWDIYQYHKWLKTEPEAAAAAVRKGTDLTCGTEYKSLGEGVKQGLIDESEITSAVKNLMRIRFRLGQFDPPERVAYQRIPYSENDSPAHHRKSLEASRESIVLLRNADRTLPFRKDLKSIAVIGPNADNEGVLLGNYNGTPSATVTALQGIRAKVSSRTEVLFSPGIYPAGVTTERVTDSSLRNGSLNGLKGEYFNNRELSGEPALVRNDTGIDFRWDSDSPAPGVVPDDFSIRWTGKLVPPDSGNYKFGWRSNGGVRIFIDGKLLLEEVQSRRTRNVYAEMSLDGGREYDLRIEFFENANEYASAVFSWTPPNGQDRLRDDALEKARKADAVVMVMGISPSVEGEEMDVKLEGFRGGDRTDISLPKPQQELIREIRATGKPVALVLMSGSALAVNWESENVPAILQAWYPGQFGGTAIADVLFGDYNPAGRLPVTFYRSVGDLPPFDDYRMEGRTYRYFRGTPLYPFGYGLSFSQFEYSGLRISPAATAGSDVTVSAVVRNSGKLAGDEVVQVYVAHEGLSVPVPIRSLAGVSRVHLRPGESRRVSFRLSPRDLSIVLPNGLRVLEPGTIRISLGGKQPGFSGSADAATTGVVSGTLSVKGKRIRIAESAP